MTSYQKLKWKCDKLQAQVDLIKQALTIFETPPIPNYDKEKNTYSFTQMITIERNKIDNYYKRQLQYWVAENLDEETIMKLLKIKKDMLK